MFNNKVYHKIDALSGSVATLRAEGVKYNEIAEIESRAGTSLAQVIKLDGPKSSRARELRSRRSSSSTVRT